MFQNVILSLGSNLSNSQFILNKAISDLGNDSKVLVEKVSAFYRTSPVGGVKQNDFINLAMNVTTNYEPKEFLARIHQIESDLNRIREVHWGPRTLDIDIIFWGDQRISEDDLVVPHVEAFNRLFVLKPVLEVINKHFEFYSQIQSGIDKLKNSDQKIEQISQKNKPDTIIENSVKNILSAVGDDPKRSGLIETPNRVMRMYHEIFSSVGQENFSDYKVFDDQPSDDKMVMLRNIPFYSMCEHHLMPFWGKVHVAYIPNHGKIIGLSKIPRLIDFVSHKLSLQEKVTDDIANQLEKILDPKGIAVVVDARHMCVEMRGVKKTESSTRTIKFTGEFSKQDSLKNEFLNSIGDINDEKL